MPGANLTSYGTVRDIGKWPERDRRTVKRDRINFEEDNPYLAGGMIDAVNTLNSLAEAHPTRRVMSTQPRPDPLHAGAKGPEGSK